MVKIAIIRFFSFLYKRDTTVSLRLYAILFESDIFFKNLFFNLVRFIITLNIVLFIKGLLLALTDFGFKGAVLFRASLHISKKESKAVFRNV